MTEKNLVVRQKMETLSRDKLQDIILRMTEILSAEQYEKLKMMIENSIAGSEGPEKEELPAMMSQKYVDEKMKLVEEWMQQIDEGELWLDTSEYEDYSSGYWDRDWITEYYDNQGIGDKIEFAIQFANDCVNDRRYKEANFIYEWLWDMTVCTDGECECGPVDLELLEDESLVHVDLEQVALLTLYADYQTQKPDNRAKDIYLYFSHYPFQKLHIEDMFGAGREELSGTGSFMEDWIALLQEKSGVEEGRLLKEAILYHEGIDGLIKRANENYATHPSLFLAAVNAYNQSHNYLQMEKICETALEKIDSDLIIRSEVALKGVYASSCLMHTEKVMQFCWESFRSDSTVRNFLRLFGTKEMAEQYGMRGQEIFDRGQRQRISSVDNPDNSELRRNYINDYSYQILNFYTGNFKKVKEASVNPKGSLGWSGSFIKYGIRLFLLYLYENPLPSKAAAATASYVGFQDDNDLRYMADFESKIIEESRISKTSLFWNYFQRWKPYFKMTEEERENYLGWAEQIVYSRADAIVGGKYRRHYGEVAVLLAMVGDVRESMGQQGAKREIFLGYKRKFPRHSSFQGEMREYFGV